MTTICLAQYKGGTGKTSSVINIAVCMKQLGYKVLVVDMDQQANLTVWLGINPTELASNISDLLTDENVAAQNILIHTKEGIDLLPSNIDLALVEMRMSPMQREMVLARKLQPIKDNYDFILIDTPPNFIMTTINAMTAADYLLVPIQPEPLCLFGLSQLTQTFDLIKRTTNPNVELLGVFITLYDARIAANVQIAEKVRQDWQRLTFETVIRRRSNVHEATLKYQSIISLYPNSELSQDYKALTREVVSRVQK